MMQSGGILADLLAAIPQVMFHTGVQGFKKTAPELPEIATEYYVNKGINKLKKFKSSKGSGIALLNNETKDIKVISSLENRRILLKGTTKKIVVNKNYFSTFLDH